MALALVLGLSGCGPAAGRITDEQKEPYFLLGKKRAAALDYKGAAEAFEKALEFNPRNASAHFELALLYERDETDLIGAIYHFDRYLRLRPDASNAGVVKDRLLRCKQLLASGVQPVSPAPALQRELERLAAENRELRRQLDAWQAYFAAAQQQQGVPPTRPTGLSATSTSTTPAQQAPDARLVAPGAAPKKHVVQRGESPYSIARMYGVKLDLLLKSNPGIDPHRLRVGQTLVIPTQ